MRTVIVRPHPLILGKMKSFLEETGSQVCIAEDHSALKSLECVEPDIVVVSTAAQSSSSWPLKEALRSVREQWPDVPVLLTTAVDELKARESLRDILGVVDPGVRVVLPDESLAFRSDKNGKLAIVVNKLRLDDLQYRQSLKAVLLRLCAR